MVYAVIFLIILVVRNIDSQLQSKSIYFLIIEFTEN